MKHKSLTIAIFVIASILLNLAGKTVANALSLPLWLDSFGTVLVAYAFGPICGSIVGVTMNVLYSTSDPASYIYSITSIAIGVIVGITARRRWFDTVFGTMSASVLLTLVAVVVSTSMSLVRTNGMTGNIWGDGVIETLREQGIPFLLCAIIGQFYIDFFDKVITLFFLFVVIKIWRMRKKLVIKIRRLLRKRRHAVIILALVTTAFAPPAVRAASIDTYVQTIYSTNNGLPCGEANAIAQTNDGILWIGTYAGLYRYNGSEFRWMNEYASVRNVNCLYLDEEGRLWIGTNDNGISICINEQIVNVLDTTKGLPSNSARGIVKSSDGYYYIGTSMGMMVVTLDSGLQGLNTIPEIGYTVSISAGINGNVAVVTSDGTLRIVNNRTITHTTRVEHGREIYTCCAFDKDGTLYAGTSQNHLHRILVTEDGLKQQGTLTCGQLENLNALYFSENRLFICADNGIGYLTDYATAEQFSFISTGDFNNSIDNMTVDYQGNFWFASSRQGLLRLSASSFTNVYGSLGMPARVVNTVTYWNHALYIGTDSGIDVIQNGQHTQNSVSRQLAGVRTRCLTVDSQNHLWVCTYGKGLLELFPDGTSVMYDSTNHTFEDRIRVCIELRDGTIVAAGNTGIAYIKNHQVQKYIRAEDGLPNAMILTLMEMNDGSLLAGTDGDGIAVIRDGAIVRQLGLPDGLTSGVILRTVSSRTGSGTYLVTSNSLLFMDDAYRIRPLDAFPYYNNYDVWTHPNGTLFVLSSAGIYVVSESDLLNDTNTFPYVLLDAKSGLSSTLTANSWNYCDTDGNLYVSCGTGVYVVNMEHYVAGKRSYRMMVNTVKLDGEPHHLERGEIFSISRDTSRIEFFPEVVNYTVLDPFVSYWLEGFDNVETIVPQSELTGVTYTNLPTGSYTFHLAVLDNDNNILEQSKYELVKEKAMHDNRWFKVYMLAVALLAVTWFTWFVAKTQVQRTIELQRQKLYFAEEQVRMGNETILAIAKTVDAKDENTSQHSTRVSEYSVLIGRELGFDEAECENLRKAALLHDIGKIGIPDRILNKPARLTDAEYAIMKTHVTKGADILKDFTVIQNVSDGARYHHERWDGKGYAEGLQGENIPIYARIIGMADAFDAMTANRIYRKKLPFDYVLNEIKNGRGTQFDPKIADIMLTLIKNGNIEASILYNKADEN